MRPPYAFIMFSIPEKAEDFDHPGWWDFCKTVLKYSAQTDIGKSILGLLAESNVQMGCVLAPNSMSCEQAFESRTSPPALANWFINIEKIKENLPIDPTENEDLLALYVMTMAPHELTHWGQNRDSHFTINTDTAEKHLSSLISAEAEAEYTRALDVMERQRNGLPWLNNVRGEFAVNTYHSTLVENARSLPLEQLPCLARLSHSKAYTVFQDYMWEQNKDEGDWAEDYKEQFKAKSGEPNTANKPQSARGNPLLPITWLLGELLRENPAFLTPSPAIEPLTEDQMLLCRDVLVGMEGIEDSTWFTKETKKDRELEIAQIMAGEMVYDPKLLNNALTSMNLSVVQEMYNTGGLAIKEKTTLFSKIFDTEAPEDLIAMLTTNQQILCDAVTRTGLLTTER